MDICTKKDPGTTFMTYMWYLLIGKISIGKESPAEALRTLVCLSELEIKVWLLFELFVDRIQAFGTLNTN